MPFREMQQVQIKKKKKKQFVNELVSNFGTELNVCAKSFERKLNVCAKPFESTFDYHTAYHVAGFNVLPQVVPINPNWKKMAGDVMCHYLFMIYGQQTGGLIVGKILKIYDIIYIRMMLQDFNLLIFSAGQALNASQERPLAFFPQE